MKGYVVAEGLFRDDMPVDGLIAGRTSARYGSRPISAII